MRFVHLDACNFADRVRVDDDPQWWQDESPDDESCTKYDKCQCSDCSACVSAVAVGVLCARCAAGLHS